eukprot:jgi/Tetstr1/450164/TSEL_037206.t1
MAKPSLHSYRVSVLALTFISYAAFHACRKPPSIVKSVLLGESSKMVVDGANIAILTDEESGWAPFNQPGGKARLGNVDLCFLLSYAIGMFFAGHMGDRMDLRVFLSMGMFASAFLVSLFGMASFWDIHNINFFYIVMILGGLCQSSGWPSVVSIMANWFGKGKRGLVMGIWNAHTSVGNIAGSVMASMLLPPFCSWGWAFIAPGIFMFVAATLVWYFLVPQPENVGLAPSYQKVASKDEETPRPKDDSSNAPRGISFLTAWAIPGVTPFALCLFFSKLVAYTFLYWLPFYIKSTEIAGQSLSASEAGTLSILFDVGGVFGGIVAGYMSDRIGASALVASVFVYVTIPVLYMFRTFGHLSMTANVILMTLSGFCVNGPYALITTAVSADLGTHESLAGSEKALATVTAIIDGMGSLGAAVGPFLVGYIASGEGGFNNVFYMLYACCLIAGLLIGKLVTRELEVLRSNKK